MIRYLDAFEDYDPYTDMLSESLRWELGDIEQQALNLLPEYFTVTELNTGLEALYQLKKHFPQAKQKHRASAPPDGKYKGIFYSQCFCYYLCTDLVEPAKLHDTEEFKWSWIFATLALASLSDYAAIESKVYQFDPAPIGLGSRIENQRGAFEIDHKSALPLMAMEALGYARLFSEREEAASKHKARGQNISKTKLANIYPLKEAVINKYNALDKPISNRKAATLIEDTLDEKLKQLSFTDDLNKQIQVWIGQYRKGTLPGQDSLPKHKP